LAYTVISLLASLVILFAIFVSGKFLLTRWTGFDCLCVYAVFLAVSVMFELNVFFPGPILQNSVSAENFSEEF
jgi:hypothetical protein